MNSIKSLIYPENTTVQCPYSLAKLQAAGQHGPDASYPILALDNRKIFKPLPEAEWFSRGRQYRVIDAIGNILAIPSKILLWNSQFHSNYISPETEEILKQYMRENRLHHVKVRINQYAPFDEIKRHFTNPRTSIVTKILSAPVTLIMQLLPIRLFGCDHYNAFTDTLHIVSNVPAIALHEAGHAKDFASRRHPGLYSLLRYIPFGELYQEAKASLDAMKYLKAKKFTKLVPDAYALLTPAFATYVAGTVLRIMTLFLKLPFSFMSGITPRLDKVVTWLCDPLVKITHPTLLKIAFILEKFPPFASRIKMIAIGLGHLAGRISGYCYSRFHPQQPMPAAA